MWTFAIISSTITIILLITYRIVCTKKVKGSIGEYNTAKALKDLSEFNLIRNPIFYTHNNNSCEIDIIMLHKTGIYVIENKAYDGAIYGNEEQYKWTQFLSKKNKFQFYNPVMQNKKHIKVLKEIINNNSDIYHNVVVFGDNCNLKKVSVNNYIILDNRKTAIKRIKARMQVTKPIFTDNQLQEIYNILISKAKFDNKARKNHITNIKK